MVSNCSAFFSLVEKTERAVVMEGGTLMDTVGHQDATFHLVVLEGGHLVVE